MEPKKKRWVDAPELNWIPNAPLYAGKEGVRQEPWAGEAPNLRPANDPLPQAANSNSALIALIPRLMVGLLQGVALSLLFQSRDFNLWASDAGLLAGLIMAWMFAPLLLIQGLGRIHLRPLLIWTLFAALCLGGLGFYHHWRVSGADDDHSGLWLAAMAAAFLFIGQALLLGASRRGPEHARYALLSESAWGLAIEIVLWGLFAGVVWALWGAGQGWLRIRYPGLPFANLTPPLLTLSLAVMSQCCGRRVLQALEGGLLFVLTGALPLMILLSTFTALAGFLSRWQPPLAFCLAQAVLMLIAINASYRGGGEWRPLWRRRAEFVGAFLLLPLVALAGMALEARVMHLGFTAPRIIAVGAVLLLAAYALTYAGAALISLGGGRWMARLESANLLMAFMALSLIATLVSPLADPIHLAVVSQNWRLAHGKVTPDAFDFAYLRDQGLRFGHDDLARMAADRSVPAIARGAFLAQAAKPISDRPAPSEIGANIRVMSPGARLPVSLLTRDWSAAGPGVPPCLTTARLNCDAYFMDLARDGRNEIVLIYGDNTSWWAGVLRQGVGGGWYVAGTIASPCPGSLAALRAGNFAMDEPMPAWRELTVNGERLVVSLIPHGRPACPK